MVAIEERRSLHFGLTRHRQVVGGAFVPLLIAGAALLSGAPWWAVAVAAALSVLLALRAFETRLSIEDDRFVVHRVRSSVSVPLAEVVAIGFARGSPNIPRPLLHLTRDGRKIRVWAVSQSRRYLELPTDGRSKGECRVDEFLMAAGVPFRVERDVDVDRS
jgi:hypothetical protein